MPMSNARSDEMAPSVSAHAAQPLIKRGFASGCTRAQIAQRVVEAREVRIARDDELQVEFNCRGAGVECASLRIVIVATSTCDRRQRLCNLIAHCIEIAMPNGLRRRSFEVRTSNPSATHDA